MGSYIYGAPEKLGSWNHVASIFAAHDSVHSEKTSSLPLVQFWQPEGKSKKPKEAARTLLEKCGLDPNDFCDAKYCFEYPVPVGKGRGKASMTDLMIITDKNAIAVEAKWTECESQYPSINDWLEEKPQSDNKTTNRNEVLDGWIEYINKYLGKEVIKRGSINLRQIPYQMLHRIASACQVAICLGSGAKAVVVYQLFYDAETAPFKDGFVEDLKKGYKELLGDGETIQFRIIETKVVKNISEDIRKWCKTDQGEDDLNELFRIMQNKPIYEFPPESIQSIKP